MNNITVITNPDILYNNVFSIFLIFPNNNIKQQINDLLLKCNSEIHVYLYDENTTDIEWLLTVAKLVDTIILDVDNSDVIVKNFASYLISLQKTFYLTNDITTPYNLINKNKIYDVTWLQNYLEKE